jgi:hypothetical protein
MKVLIEVQDEQASFLMELLKNLSFIKYKTLTPAKAQFLEELREAVDNVNLVKQGRLKARPLKEVLDAL